MRGVRHTVDMLDWFADHGVSQAPAARLIDELGIARSSFYDLMSILDGSAILGAAGRGTIGRGPLALDAGLATTGLGRDWAGMEKAVATLAAALGRPVRLWVPDGADALLILDAGTHRREAGRRRPLLSMPAGWLLAAALPERRRRFLDPGDPAHRQTVAATVARLAAASGAVEVLSDPRHGSVAVRALGDAGGTVRGALAVDLGEQGAEGVVAALEVWSPPR